MKTILYNPLKSLSLLLLGIAIGGTSSAQLVPLPLTAASFNQDLVAESGSNPTTVTSAAMDGGGNNIFYSLAFAAANSSVLTSGGLPNNGVITNGSNTWQLQSYSANNALFFAPQSATSTQSMFLSSPAQFSQISLLDAAGYGPTSVTITLHFTNGTSTNYGTFSILDWFDQTPFVVEALGRINRNTTVSNNNAPATDPRLYQTAITLNAADQLKTLNRIDILDNSTNNQATAAFFALSGVVTTTLALEQLTVNGQYQSSANVVSLSWNVTGTADAALFDVQRSTNGTDFNTIGSVSATNIATGSTYSYADNDMVRGQTYFYRIVETENGGPELYSNIIHLQTAAPSGYTVATSGNTLYVNNAISSLPANFEIFGLSGQLYLKGIAPAASNFSLDIHSLAHGVYVIRLANQDQSQSIEFLR
jgi:hypothetical protein